MKAILNSNVYQSNGTCNELQTFGFSSHPSCYSNNGFCTDILLSSTNLRCLSVAIQYVVDFFAFFRTMAFQQVSTSLITYFQFI